MGEPKAPEPSKKELLAQEASKRILKDIRGKRQSPSLAQSSENVAAEENPLQEKARQGEERTVSGFKKDSARKGHRTRVYREAAVKRRNCHALDPTSAPGLPVRAQHPERVGVLPEQKKSPLSRLEESLEYLNLNRTEFLGSHSVRGPELAPFSSSAPVVEPISRRERTHVLHGHGRRSTGTNTPEIWGSNGFQDSISAPHSISSAKQEIVPGSTPPHAQSNTLPPNHKKSDMDTFCSTQHSTEGDHQTQSPPWKDHTTSGPDVQAWLAYDEGYFESSALASAIFYKRMLGDLKKQSLNPLDVINMVDSSWNRLSPEECRAFEKQAMNTAKAIQETANAATGEIEMNRVAETAKRDIIDRLMMPFHRLFGSNLNGSSDYLTGNESSWGCSQSGCTSIDLEPADGNDNAGRTQVTQRRDRSHCLATQADPASRLRKKHGRDSHKGESDCDEGDGNGKRRKPSSTKPDGGPGSPRRFACPFAKHFPDRTWESAACTHKGFSSIHRVKEHLYRVHQQPRHRCFRCYETFNDEAQFKAHARAAVRCDEMEEPPDNDAIDDEQEAQLKSKRLGRDSSEEYKWKLIYLICFRDVEEAYVPSPYFETPALRPPITQDFELFEQYQRERLPQIVREDLEHLVQRHPQMAPLMAILEGPLTETVRTALSTVRREYRSSEAASSSSEGEASRQYQRAHGIPNMQASMFQMHGLLTDGPWTQASLRGQTGDFRSRWAANPDLLAVPPSASETAHSSLDDTFTMVSASTSEWQFPVLHEDPAYSSGAAAPSNLPSTPYPVGGSSSPLYADFDTPLQQQTLYAHPQGSLGGAPALDSVAEHPEGSRAQSVCLSSLDHRGVGAQFDGPDAGSSYYNVQFPNS